MTVTARSLRAALAGIPDADVADAPAALAEAAVDGRAPRWIARPRAVEALAAVLALAHEERLAVVPRGSGSALTLGHPPARVDLVLDVRGLAGVLEHNPDDLTVSVQAGITAGALASRLAAHQQLLAVDPPGAADRTLGGIVATRASGPLRARYGTVRDLLLGVRFVQADGVVTWGGARVVKSVTGYDVPKLMTGALGTLGVLVELTLRLHSTPEFEGTCLVTASHADAAQAFVAAVLDSALQPSRLEFLGAAALAACDLPPGPAAVAVSFSTVEAAVRAQQAALEPLAGRLGARVQTMGATFWRTYDRRLADAGPVTLRVTAPSSRLAATVREVEAALAAGGSVPLVAGGAAFGTLQASFAPAHPAAARTAVERLRDAVADVAGSVVVEKGPREVREAVDPWGPVAEPALALMRDLKRQFDPHGVLNPGRFVGGI